LLISWREALQGKSIDFCWFGGSPKEVLINPPPHKIGSQSQFWSEIAKTTFALQGY
jgi:hypothetical protein